MWTCGGIFNSLFIVHLLMSVTVNLWRVHRSFIGDGRDIRPVGSCLFDAASTDLLRDEIVRLRWANGREEWFSDILSCTWMIQW